MTITVKDFIEWMKQFPEDTEVGVLTVTDDHRHDDFDHQFVGNVNELPHSFVDFTSNQFVKSGSAHFNKRFLELGCK